MKVILHGMLKDQFVEAEIGGETVAEVIEGWSRQCGLAQIPLEDRPTIEVIDFEDSEKLFEKTDVTEIHLAPAMFGGKGGFGQILIGAALVAASFIPGLNAAVAAGMMAADIGMTIGGVMALFMKAPTLNASDEPEASRYLGSDGNTTQIGTLITKGYGRMKAGGQYMSVQVNAQDMVYGTFPTSI